MLSEGRGWDQKSEALEKRSGREGAVMGVWGIMVWVWVCGVRRSGRMCYSYLLCEAKQPSQHFCLVLSLFCMPILLYLGFKEHPFSLVFLHPGVSGLV